MFKRLSLRATTKRNSTHIHRNMNLKRKYKRLLGSIGLCILSLSAYSQDISDNALGYFNDAILFSQTSFSGSGRILGIAGAQTALGGDVSNIAHNPAGLGYYRRSEISFSPSLQYANTQTDYILPFSETRTQDDKINFHINHLGLVFFSGKDPQQQGKWRGGSIGLALTRVNNFQNRISLEGTNTTTSRTDSYVELTNGIPLSTLENFDEVAFDFERGAYNTFLTNPFDLDQNGNPIADPDTYFTLARDENENLISDIQQKQTIDTKGSQYQFNLAFGGNYDDKLYVGAGLGIGILNYEQDSEYSESIGGNSFLDSFTESNEFNLSGTGFNAQFGLIYRMNDWVRLGASFQTPTFYFINEESISNFSSLVFDTLDNLIPFEFETLPQEFDYRLQSPWRLNLGTSFFFNKLGFISIDAEYVDYTSMKLRNSDFPGFFDADNQTIESIYRPVWNFRLGSEFRFDYLRFRGGFAYEADPYDSDFDDIDKARYHITGGFGVRVPEFYIDLGLQYTWFESPAFNTYSLDPNGFLGGLAPVNQSENTNIRLIISAGLFF